MKALCHALALLILCVGCSGNYEVPPYAPLCGEVVEIPDCDINMSTPAELGDFIGEKATLIMFYTGGCSYCHEEMTIFPEIKEEFGDGVSIIVILLKDIYGASSEKKLCLWSCFEERKYGGDIHYLIQLNMDMYETLGGNGVPYNIFLDSQCNVAGTLFGADASAIKTILRGVVNKGL